MNKYEIVTYQGKKYNKLIADPSPLIIIIVPKLPKAKEIKKENKMRMSFTLKEVNGH